MGPVITCLLLSLLSSDIMAFITGAFVAESRFVSIEKLPKLCALGLGFVTIFTQRGIKFPRSSFTHLLPAVLFFSMLLINQISINVSDPSQVFRGWKEMMRLAAIISIFLLCSLIRSRTSSLLFFIRSFAVLGFCLGLFALHSSLATNTGPEWRYVGSLYRAGSGLTNACTLAGALALTSMLGVAGYIVETERFARFAYCVMFMVSQIGRAVTFSTGAWLNSFVTFIALLILYWLYNRKVFFVVRNYLLVILLIFSAILWKGGLFDTIFYRLIPSDEAVWSSSIGSRIAQYEGLMDLVSRKPSVLIFGVGIASCTDALGLETDMHNSYVRPLIAGGVLCFASYLFLCLLCTRDFLLSIRQSQGNREKLNVSLVLFAAFLGWSVQSATAPMDTSSLQWFFFIVAYSLSLRETGGPSTVGINQLSTRALAFS